MNDFKVKDDGLTGLFDDFKPSMESGVAFMRRLERNLDMIEAVRKVNAEQCRRSRVAVCVAAVAGFVVGVVFAVCMPSLLTFLKRVGNVLSPVDASETLADGFMLAAWLVAGLVTVFVALNAYEVSMALQKRLR